MRRILLALVLTTTVVFSSANAALADEEFPSNVYDGRVSVHELAEYYYDGTFMVNPAPNA